MYWHTLLVSSDSMYTKILTVILLLAVGVTPIGAQNWDAVKTDRSYYHGEGYGASVAEAKSNAIAQLLESISMQIEVEGTHKIKEQEKMERLTDSRSSSVLPKPFQRPN